MNTRGKTTATSSAKPSAKPTVNKATTNPRSKRTETSAPPKSSSSGGKKRKQKEPSEDADEDSHSAEDMAQFQAWKAADKLKSDAARQRALKAAKNKATQDANAQLLAAELARASEVEEEARENQDIPRKKSKTNVLLDDDEEEAIRNLSRGVPAEEEDEEEDEEERGPPVDDDEEGGIYEDEVINVSPTKRAHSSKPSSEPEDDKEEDGDEFSTNGLEIVKSALKLAVFPRGSRAESRAPSRASSRAPSRAPSSAPSARGNSKVTRADFDSESLRALADAGKSTVRMNILFGRWHTTHGGKADSHQWAADILQTVIKEKPLLRKALTAAFQDELVKENLLTYVLYGKGALLNTFIGKACLLVASSYGLTGRKEDITGRVTWLLKKTQFAYGGINFEAGTVEKTKIWGNPMIKELLQVVLFGQGAKADARSIQEVRKTKSIPISAIILSVTAIEHAIGEYRDGSSRQYPFKEQGVRKRYTYHENNWNTLRELSKKWATFYLQGVFQAIAAVVDLDDMAGGLDAGDDVEGITAMDLDVIAEENTTPF
ncbi:hypothetical protein FA13DRAFT_1796294 [Coprinellus micaceus]|uniref:DUF6532 domain-containing protein n=1 Tax=Coprinellus micaceus TaxID=71717 RepID=A0A4Y7SUW1_COPMI|nr:hypothetical protein FA13DRAFT_1796294 [Coprinellus micaceus]